VPGIPDRPAASTAAVNGGPGRQPSLALIGGRVRSPSQPGVVAEALAIGGRRILAVGTTGEIRDLCGPRTRVVDLRDRLAIPAFGDAHVHPVGAGLESMQCDLTGERSRHAYVDAVSAYAARLPAGAWVLGGGWSMEAFPGGLPAAVDLDAAAAGRPVFLPNRDHHSAWVSSAALRLAGIDGATPDPPDGRIERDDNGEPTGALHDGAMRLVGDLSPRPGKGELLAALLYAQRRLHALGITHWQDAIVGRVNEIGVSDAFDAYVSAEAAGVLSATVVGALWWDRRRGLDQLEEILSRREAASGERFRAASVKIMLDGVCETLTAAMSTPYAREAGASSGAPPAGTGSDGDHRGSLFIEPDELTAVVQALAGLGFQLHFHAIGDRAVSVALDALAALPPTGRADGRHHIAHLQFVHPDDLARIAAVGAVANFQPLWACRDPQMEVLTVPLVGVEREAWQYRIGSIARAGARLAFGSDWPVSSPDPLQEMHVAVNRCLSGRIGRAGTPECDAPLLADEAVTVGQALAAFTSGVAFVNHREHELGALEAGYLADVAVLDRDILAHPSHEIGDAAVELTIAGGEVVHGEE
jgi:predicted amidohydrolase YtcJ